MIQIRTNIAYAQCKNCFFALHIGSVLILLKKPAYQSGHRLEICTPYHWIRFHKGKK